MYGLTRATTTLIGAAVAGFLLWLAVEVVEGEESAGEYWSSVGLVAAAGLVMALSQLLGGWTKWGWPRVSGQVFLIAFLPVLIVSLWFVLAGQPEGEGWLRGDVLDWSDDLGIEGFVEQMLFVLPVIVFGTGLVFGFTFDTSGPRVVTEEPVAAAPPPEERVAATPTPPADERVVERRDDEANETVVTSRDDDDETVVERRPPP
jgi:hypothetical protein